MAVKVVRVVTISQFDDGTFDMVISPIDTVVKRIDVEKSITREQVIEKVTNALEKE